MQSYFLVHDYDNTAAETNVCSPSGMTVPLAYQLSIEDILGNRALKMYQEQGGLGNRSPLELVRDLIHSNDSKQEIEMAQLLVEAKLSYLIPEISSAWPLPTSGFKKYWETLADLNDSNLDITTGVVSSGHEKFIRASFEAWGIPQPHILITEDDVRQMDMPRADLRIKPGPIPLALAYEGWIHRTGQDRGISPLSAIGKVGYFGDDPYKDGRMSNMAGAVFGLFTHEGNNSHGMAFNNWEEVSQKIVQHQDLLIEGKSLGEIFNKKNVRDAEGISSYGMRA